jgi:putative transposase
LALVNAPEKKAELEALRRSVRRGCPFGDPSWSDRTVRRLGLEMTVRPHGRPRKQRNGP